MSGICGIFRLDGPPLQASAVGPMLDALRPFGPDGASWADPSGTVALGAVPTRVTPEDLFHHPPVRSLDGALALVADVRLDNRDELEPALGIPAADARERSDADLVLAAYEAWGDAAVAKLVGDFAFALWDGRRRRLLTARDGIGHRLLYYHATDKRIAFATIPGALLALPDVTARLNEQRIAESLVLMQDPVTTFYAGIERLRPGHTLSIAAEGTRFERYWSPIPERRITLGSDDEYVEAFLEVFDRAVRAQTRSRLPLGVMLSGGLDSPSIAATAALQLRDRGERLRAFHAAPRAGFSGATRPGWIADESSEVAIAASRYDNLDLEIYRPTGGSLLTGLEEVFRYAGLPPRNPSAGDWFDAIYGSAKRQGIGVMLAGHKGNATISYGGVRSLRDLAREGRIGHVVREVRAVARATRQSTWAVLREQILAPLTPRWIAAAQQRLRGPQGAALWSSAYSAISPELARSTGVDRRARESGVVGLEAARAGELEYRAMALTAAADAPDLDNAARAQFGIETRSPACDLRVVNYCLAIPGSQYLRNGVSRWLIRRAMRDRLPSEVVDRTTRGAQGADWAEWMVEMRDEFRTDLSRFEREESVRRCLDLPRMRSLVEQWPERLGPAEEMAYHHLLLRGVTMGRFILWFERTHGSGAG
ncbi:MAG: asparagine synthase-related protein [Gemmatimonadales bacterium]